MNNGCVRNLGTEIWTCTVDENIIGVPKMENNCWCSTKILKHWTFICCPPSPPHIVIAIPNLQQKIFSLLLQQQLEDSKLQREQSRKEAKKLYHKLKKIKSDIFIGSIRESQLLGFTILENDIFYILGAPIIFSVTVRTKF